MKINHLVIFLIFGLLITIDCQKSVAQSTRCPNIIGKWYLNGEKLTITDKGNCRIGGSYLGENAGLSFEGSWDKANKVYRYSGYVTSFIKGTSCEARVTGKLTVKEKSLRTSLTKIETICWLPWELRGPLVFRR